MAAERISRFYFKILLRFIICFNKSSAKRIFLMNSQLEKFFLILAPAQHNFAAEHNWLRDTRSGSIDEAQHRCSCSTSEMPPPWYIISDLSIEMINSNSNIKACNSGIGFLLRIDISLIFFKIQKFNGYSRFIMSLADSRSTEALA